jgi:hypothetical protein
MLLKCTDWHASRGGALFAAIDGEENASLNLSRLCPEFTNQQAACERDIGHASADTHHKFQVNIHKAAKGAANARSDKATCGYRLCSAISICSLDTGLVSSSN